MAATDSFERFFKSGKKVIFFKAFFGILGAARVKNAMMTYI
jgi:hypothetical protein